MFFIPVVIQVPQRSRIGGRACVRGRSIPGSWLPWSWPAQVHICCGGRGQRPPGVPRAEALTHLLGSFFPWPAGLPVLGLGPLPDWTRPTHTVESHAQDPPVKTLKLTHRTRHLIQNEFLLFVRNAESLEKHKWSESPFESAP